MTRLTYKDEKVYGGYSAVETDEFACVGKLGQLEDIEELCEKVVEKPIYEKFIDTHEVHKEDYTECRALYNFKHNRIELYMHDFVNYLELDQYGKTWALTKEELL